MRDHRLRPWIWLVGLLGLICPLTSVLLPAKEAAAHPIDEYVQNTYIDPAPDRTTLELNLTPGVLVAPEMVALIDTDGDGEISETEGDAYANEVLRNVSLEVDGEPQPLTLTSSQFPTPLDIRAGMGTIRLQVAAKAPEGVPGDHSLSFRNDHEPVNSKYLLNAFKKSSEVEIAKQDRDQLQHAIRVDYAIAPQTSSGSSDSADPSTEDTEADLGTTADVSDRAQWLASYLYEPALSPWLLILGLGLSALLGGLHALTPGHGKTLVAAYLIGSRGTVKHAAALGGIVTFTHTASVIAVGLLALLASQLILPGVLVPVLEVCAGLLVVALGVRLVRERWRIRGGAHHHHHDHHHDHHHEHDHQHLPTKVVKPSDLLAMGVSGGLVPCPEALGVMLIAIGLERIALGLGLIVAFSLGLAAVLIAIGILLVRFRGVLDRLGKPGSHWQRLLPLVSAVIVTLLGVGIVLKGLVSYVL